MTTEPESISPHLTIPAYAIASVLCTVPVGELALRIWPFNGSSVPWRFAAIGVGSGELVLPLLGLGIFFAIASARRNARAVLVIAFFAGCLSVALWLLLPIFLLDAAQMSGSVSDEGHSQVVRASAGAAVKIVIFAIVASVYFVAAVRILRADGQRRRHRRKDSLRETVVGVRAPLQNV